MPLPLIYFPGFSWEPFLKLQPASGFQKFNFIHNKWVWPEVQPGCFPDFCRFQNMKVKPLKPTNDFAWYQQEIWILILEEAKVKFSSLFFLSFFSSVNYLGALENSLTNFKALYLIKYHMPETHIPLTLSPSLMIFVLTFIVIYNLEWGQHTVSISLKSLYVVQSAVASHRNGLKLIWTQNITLAAGLIVMYMVWAKAWLPGINKWTINQILFLWWVEAYGRMNEDNFHQCGKVDFHRFMPLTVGN